MDSKVVSRIKRFAFEELMAANYRVFVTYVVAGRAEVPSFLREQFENGVISMCCGDKGDVPSFDFGMDDVGAGGEFTVEGKPGRFYTPWVNVMSYAVIPKSGDELQQVMMFEVHPSEIEEPDDKPRLKLV